MYGSNIELMNTYHTTIQIPTWDGEAHDGASMHGRWKLEGFCNGKVSGPWSRVIGIIQLWGVPNQLHSQAMICEPVHVKHLRVL